MRYYFLFLLLLAGLLACNKECTTVVTGRITNYRTGEPIVGHPVVFTATEKCPRFGYCPPDGRTQVAYDATDGDGRYTVALTGNFEGGSMNINSTFSCSFPRIYRDGELRMGHSDNMINYQFEVTDAILYVVLHNSSGIPPIIEGPHCFDKKFYLKTTLGAIDTVKFPVIGDQEVGFHWSLSPLKSTNVGEQVKQFCPIGGVGYADVFY
jgi:hypothetical protein